MQFLLFKQIYHESLYSAVTKIQTLELLLSLENLYKCAYTYVYMRVIAITERRP